MAKRHTQIITLWVSGEAEYGLGHVKRCLVLAEALMTAGAKAVRFVCVPHSLGAQLIERAGWAVNGEVNGSDKILIDLALPLTRPQLFSARRDFGRVYTLGGTVHGDLVDCQIAQSILPLAETGPVLNGVQYVIVDPRYRDLKSDPDGPLVISCGGRDPLNMTERVVAALQDYDRRVITGPGRADLPGSIHAPESLVPYLGGASAYVGALGMTAYEALAAGLPCLLFNWSDAHERTTEALNKQGVALNLGQPATFGERGLHDLLNILPYMWVMMRRKAKALVDGRGAARVAEYIIHD